MGEKALFHSLRLQYLQEIETRDTWVVDDPNHLLHSTKSFPRLIIPHFQHFDGSLHSEMTKSDANRAGRGSPGIDMFHDMFASMPATICFTICLCISPNLDGIRGTKNETLFVSRDDMCPERPTKLRYFSRYVTTRVTTPHFSFPESNCFQNY